MLQRTPLYETHLGLGARLIDFGGWEMPVQYQGIVEEARATRTAVGLFDIGHMGRIELVGEDHAQAADWVVTCDVLGLGQGRVKYGIFTNERGTALDDVLVYRDTDRTHLVVNAGNRLRDRDHVREQIAAKGFRAKAIDTADEAEPHLAESFLGCAQQMLALQGPNSEKLLQRLTDVDLSKLGYYRMTRGKLKTSIPAVISRTGYTGEDGFELFFDRREAVRMWDVLVAQGRDLGLAPIGLGARDALRTEAGMPLYGHELDLDTTPLEANLLFGVQLDRGDFLGRDALLRQRAEGVKKTLVGFEVDTKRVPRNGCDLLENGTKIGTVASGTWSPTFEKNIAMGFVPPRLAAVGSTFDVDIRGKSHGCVVVPLPFYKRAKK